MQEIKIKIGCTVNFCRDCVLCHINYGEGFCSLFLQRLVRNKKQTDFWRLVKCKNAEVKLDPPEEGTDAV